MGKALGIGVAVLGGLLIVAAFALGVVACWAHGPDAGRWGNTAMIVGFLGCVFGVGGGAAAAEL